MTWEGDYLIDGKHNSQEVLNKIFNHPDVITLDELQDLFGMKQAGDINI